MYSLKKRKNAERRDSRDAKKNIFLLFQSKKSADQKKGTFFWLFFSAPLRLCVSAFFFLVGCGEIEHPNTRRETFAGRYQTEAVYQAKAPLHWERVETEGDLTDTKVPIGSFKIGEGLLTVHNFPGQMIPPEAQVKRWQGQVPESYYDVRPFTVGGFGGFRLEAEGMIAYAMQLTPVIFRAMNTPDLKADYTLKFVGDVELNRADVDAFARSFEFVTPIEYGRL